MKTLLPIALIILFTGCGESHKDTSEDVFQGPVSVDIFDISENNNETIEPSSDKWVYVGDRMVIGYLEKGAQRKVDVYFFDEYDRLQDRWQIDCKSDGPTEVKKIESINSDNVRFSSFHNETQQAPKLIPDEEIINEIVHQLNYSSDPMDTPGSVKDFNWLGGIISV